jgi:hypothetical protein
VLFTLAALPQSLVAQSCLGQPPFASRPVRIGLQGAVAQGTKLGGLTFGAGVWDGPFAETTVELQSFDGVSRHATSVGLKVGNDVIATAAMPTPYESPQSVSLCPIGAVTYTSLPFNDGSGGQHTAHVVNIGGGLAVGGYLPVSPSLAFIPFAAFDYYYSQVSVSSAGYGSASQDASFGALDLGVGVAIARSVTLRPGVSIPVNVTGGTPSYGLLVSFHLGGPKP